MIRIKVPSKSNRYIIEAVVLFVSSWMVMVWAAFSSLALTPAQHSPWLSFPVAVFGLLCSSALLFHALYMRYLELVGSRPR